jgi:hypothetical protein
MGFDINSARAAFRPASFPGPDCSEAVAPAVEGRPDAAGGTALVARELPHELEESALLASRQVAAVQEWVLPDAPQAVVPSESPAASVLSAAAVAAWVKFRVEEQLRSFAGSAELRDALQASRAVGGE